MKNSWAAVFVRVHVCYSIFGNSARTAGPTGVAPFDAPNGRNDDGACHESVGGTCRRVKACKKKIARPWGSNRRIHHHGAQTCGSHAFCPNLKSFLGHGVLRAM